jgi:hypothetical protein
MARKNPRRPSYKLNFNDAVEVWLMYWDGHLQSRIAARFDTNIGRISEVVNEKTHVGSRAAAMAKRQGRAA